MTISRGAVVNVGLRAAGLALVGAATLNVHLLAFAWPSMTPPGAAITGVFVGVFALAPLVVERLARRWPASRARDVAAALLAWGSAILWGVPGLIQAARARTLVDGGSLDAASSRALAEGQLMLAQVGPTLTLLAACGAVFFPTTLLALRPGRLRVEVPGAALLAVLLAALVLLAGDGWRWPEDCQLVLVLVGAAAAASPPLHRLGERVERRLASEE